MSATMESTMPRKKKEPQEEKTTMKVNKSKLRRANIVALHLGIDLFDYIDAIITPAIDKDYDQMHSDYEKTKKPKSK